jgi:hypothetical protein
MSEKKQNHIASGGLCGLSRCEREEAEPHDASLAECRAKAFVLAAQRFSRLVPWQHRKIG